MDIYCGQCGEPWENDTLHEVEGLNYMQAAEAFKLRGCAALMEPPRPYCKASPVVSDNELASIVAAMELSEYPEEWDYDLARAIYA
tara:strand:+ start:222 stop:479 length:258 start_codon:yes stop_codon:yes gene_type:complete